MIAAVSSLYLEFVVNKTLHQISLLSFSRSEHEPSWKAIQLAKPYRPGVQMKSIIPAAGLGTRFLPATKVTPKEMLPVLDKPVIQYVVEEALAPAEVDECVIVTSPSKPQIASYFTRDPGLEDLLRSRGKDAYANAVAQAGSIAVRFCYQSEPRGLGHAVRCAAHATGDEPFFVLLGDYVVPDKKILPRMKEASDAHGGASVIAVAPCPADEVSRYGIIAGEYVGAISEFPNAASEEPGAVWRMTGMVEKPDVEEAPSRLFAVGRYLLSPHVMDLLANQQPGAGNEVQLTDAMVRSMAQEEFYALVIDPAEGYDTGTPAGWIATNARLAAADPRFAKAYEEAMAL